MDRTEQPIDDLLTSIHASFVLDDKRFHTPPSPALVTLLRNARRERNANLTRAKARELRGEVTPRLLRRMQKMPPGRIMQRMTDTERSRDRAMRSASWAGYAGRVKRKIGMTPPKGYENVPLD